MIVWLYREIMLHPLFDAQYDNCAKLEMMESESSTCKKTCLPEFEVLPIVPSTSVHTEGRISHHNYNSHQLHTCKFIVLLAIYTQH